MATQGSDPLRFHDEEIDESQTEWRLELVDAPMVVKQALEEAPTALVAAQKVAALLGGPSSGHWDTRIQVEVLVPHRPMTIPDGRAVYFRRAH
jgi:hypothetical protein